MTTNRISAAIDSVYRERQPFAQDKDRGDEMSAEWSIPLHRCHRRLTRLRDQLPEHHDLLLVIWRDMFAAIEATRLQVRKLGIDTSNPLRRKPAVSQPQPVQPELTAPEQPGENPAETQTEPKAIPEETRIEPKANPEETRIEPKANPEETRAEPKANPDGVVFSARPIRSAAASALRRLARALDAHSSCLPTSLPVAPLNETPKGPTE